MNYKRIWEFKEYDLSLAQDIVKELGISMFLAKLLTQRVIDTCEEARRFLFGSLEDLMDPFHLSGMQSAVNRIKQAITNQERVVIYGDYDADGVCSTVLLIECLSFLGCEPDYYVPDRFSEGYGLNPEAVKKLAGKGYQLLISVDCGIASIAEAALAADLGLDLIITDHHNPGDKIPEAVAVINPKLDSPGSCRDLAGVGVVFKLAQALCQDSIADRQVYDWLDLVALATVADIVPLVGDNRIMLKYGLERLKNTARPGLKALMSKSGLKDSEISVWHIGFVLAPRINSAGRLASARSSVDLLLEEDEQEALKTAELLCEMNHRRKSIEEEIYKEAVLLVQNTLDLEEEQILVVAGEQWHEGVIGIVASRLCEKFKRSVILISWEGDTGRGSARSIPGLDIFRALDNCSDCLIRFGGHKMAAGLSMERQNFQQFKEKINGWAKENLQDSEIVHKEYIDMEIEVEDINEALLREVELLQPFGEGNPWPRFALRTMDAATASLVGKDRAHLKLRVEPGALGGIAFNRADFMQLPLDDCYHDIACEIEENEFRGQKSLQLKVRDIKTSFLPDNIYAKDFLLKGHLGAISRSMEEIRAKRPVLFVYPTFRDLQKHRLLLHGFFKIHVLRVLHGRVPAMNRNRLINDLRTGIPHVYLLTRAFLCYYLRFNELPSNLGSIIQVWPSEGSEEWEKHLKNFKVEQVGQSGGKIDLKQGNWDSSGSARTLIYSNRCPTVRKISHEMENITLETGIRDVRTRNILRRSFWDCKSGVLLTDGAFAQRGFASEKSPIEEVLFADLPFTVNEYMAVIEQLPQSEDISFKVLFSRDDYLLNHNYLEKQYPGLQTIKMVFAFFKGRDCRNPIRENTDDLCAAIEAYAGHEIKGFKLLPALQVLLDLGLCQLKKKGSIIEIKFMNIKSSVLDLNNSPYYLEGLYEKRAFRSMEMELNSILQW